MARSRPGCAITTPYKFDYEQGDVVYFVSSHSPLFLLRKGTFWQDSMGVRWVRTVLDLPKRSKKSRVKQFCVEDVLVQRVLRGGVVVAQAAGFKARP